MTLLIGDISCLVYYSFSKALLLFKSLLLKQINKYSVTAGLSQIIISDLYLFVPLNLKTEARLFSLLTLTLLHTDWKKLFHKIMTIKGQLHLIPVQMCMLVFHGLDFVFKVLTFWMFRRIETFNFSSVQNFKRVHIVVTEFTINPDLWDQTWIRRGNFLCSSTVHDWRYFQYIKIEYNWLNQTELTQVTEAFTLKTLTGRRW